MRIRADAVVALRPRLEEAGYTEEVLDRALGLDVLRVGGRSGVLDLDRLAGDEALGTLVRLFLLDAPVERGAAAAALAPLTLERLEQAALLESGDGSIRSTVRIQPWRDFFFAHDREVAPLRPDHVLRVGPGSRMVADLTVRRPVAAALDLGTGCGVQALLASRHSGQVVGVDVNPRALGFAELNARLNGVANVEWREGSLFEPVASSEFDLIVANPPFVVSPERELLFRDSGEPGDTISRVVVSQAPRFLRDGGYAHVLCNWLRRRGDDWSEAPRRWVDGSGCDAWLLHHRTDDPVRYAVAWNEAMYPANSPAFSAALERWLAHYREQGIEAITTGAVILRRRSGPNWVRADEMPAGPGHAGGAHALRVFEAQDYLATVKDDRALLDDVFQLVDGHRLGQSLVYADGAYALQLAQFRLPDGVGVRARVSSAAFDVLSRLTRRRRLREAIEQAADETGLDRDALATEGVAAARELLALGLLLREQTPE